jgi:hypothetical protein
MVSPTKLQIKAGQMADVMVLSDSLRADIFAKYGGFLWRTNMLVVCQQFIGAINRFSIRT